MIPVGLCGCGCGEPTPLAPKTIAARGWRKGEPIRFIHNHHRRGVLGPRTTYVIEDRGYQTPCHIGQGYVKQNGYIARWSPTRKAQCSAHVVVWEEAHGPVPDGLELDHLCRVRACVREDHLELVTHAENCRRGRRTNLTPEIVREVRRLRGQMTQAQIAVRLSIAKHAVADIHAGRKWRTVA